MKYAGDFGEFCVDIIDVIDISSPNVIKIALYKRFT